NLKSNLKNQQDKLAALNQKKDFLEYQLNEIRQVNYLAGEFTELEDELNVVKNAADISEIIHLAEHLFEGSENNLLDQVRGLIQRVSAIQTKMEVLKNLS